MIKINVKKIVKILAIFIIIMIMCLCCTVQAATNKNEQVSNLIEDVTDEEEVSTTIKDLILTINSEGMSKSLLQKQSIYIRNLLRHIQIMRLRV